MRENGIDSVMRSCIVMLMVLLVSACANNPVTGEQDFVLMSEVEELALGQQHSRQVMKEYRRYDSPVLQGYVQSVGNRVAKVSHRSNLNFEFTLLDSTQVNAFALPGGHIYITRGLLVYLNSEAELAAVLGHEVGHVTARHSVRQHGLSTMTNLFGSVLGVATGSRSVGQITNMLGVGVVRGYGREHELEADGLGVEYLVKAGYPASSMRQVITTLKNQEVFDKKLAIEQGREPRAYHGIFSTHPDNDTRLQKVLEQARGPFQLESGNKKQDIVFLRKLAGLTFGDSEQDGIIRKSSFYHSGLNFKVMFPEGWQVSNGQKAIAAQQPKGEAFIQLRLQKLDGEQTPEQLLKANLGAIISEQSLSVGSFIGHTVVVNGKTPYGQGKIRIAVLFVEKQAFVFFASAKKAAAFEYFDRLFLKAIKSFSRLSAADKKLASELKIRLTKISGSKSIRTLAKESAIAHHAEDQLRLLNDYFPVGEPKSGDLVKIVR